MQTQTQEMIFLFIEGGGGGGGGGGVWRKCYWQLSQNFQHHTSHLIFSWIFQYIF